MSTELRGLASLAIAPLVTGRQRPARLAGLVRGALYLDLADRPDVIAIVASDATRLPNALAVPVPTAGHPFRGLTPRCPVTVGDGRVSAGALRITIAGTWDPRPSIGVPGRSELADRLIGLRGVIADSRASGITFPDRLLEACLRQDTGRARPEIASLIGRGPGLTPSGDDLLAGFLAALRLLGGDGTFADDCAAGIAMLAPSRTTALSAALLRLATSGQVCGEVAGLLRALAGGWPPLGAAVARLSAVGHTSGADLVRGVYIGGCAALAARGGPPPGALTVTHL